MGPPAPVGPDPAGEVEVASGEGSEGADTWGSGQGEEGRATSNKKQETSGVRRVESLQASNKQQAVCPRWRGPRRWWQTGSVPRAWRWSEKGAKSGGKRQMREDARQGASAEKARGVERERRWRQWRGWSELCVVNEEALQRGASE